MPAWFKVNTPLGNYNPDWALLVNNNNQSNLYYIVETKPKDFDVNGRKSEEAKTKCGKIHFKKTLGIGYEISKDGKLPI